MNNSVLDENLQQEDLRITSAKIITRYLTTAFEKRNIILFLLYEFKTNIKNGIFQPACEYIIHD